MCSNIWLHSRTAFRDPWIVQVSDQQINSLGVAFSFSMLIAEPSSEFAGGFA
jgi:hypothetical protein